MPKLKVDAFDFKGVDFRIPPTMLNPQYFSRCQNVVIRDGVVSQRPGHTTFAANILEKVVAMATLQMFTGYWYLVAFTQQQVFVFNNVSEEFDCISGDKYFSVDAPGWCWLSIRDQLVISNGQDGMWEWHGHGDIKQMEDADGEPVTISPRVMLAYGERICIYNVNDGVQQYPQRIQASTILNLGDFTGTGSYGADLFTQLSADKIVNAEVIADTVMVYGEAHIVGQYYVGGEKIFDVQPIVLTKGLWAPNTLVAFPDKHYFLGRDNVYSFSGSAIVDVFGDQVRKELFRTIDKDNHELAFMEYREETGELVLFYPTAGMTYCDKYVAYNILTQCWVQGTAMHYCGSRYRTVDSLQIGELLKPDGTSIKFSEWPGTIGEAIIGSNVPYTAYSVVNTNTPSISTYAVFDLDFDNMIGDNDLLVALDRWANDEITDEEILNVIDLWAKDTRLYSFSPTRIVQLNVNDLTDWDEAIECYVDTKDFTADKPDEYLYFWSLLLEVRGNGLIVQYSTDEGSSFTNLVTTSIDSSWQSVWSDLDIVGKKVRFRIKNFDKYSYFQLRRLIIEMDKGSNLI